MMEKDISPQMTIAMIDIAKYTLPLSVLMILNRPILVLLDI
jgi:hypothetical protein